MSVAPFVQTSLGVARKMIDMAEIKPDEVLYDLGCGDGRLLTLAAQNGVAKAIGIEYREDVIARARAEVKRLNLEDKITLIQADFFDVPLSEADVVTLYLSPAANERLRPKLEAELKPCARVISHDFEIPEWKPNAIQVHDLGGGWNATIYAYQISGTR